MLGCVSFGRNVWEFVDYSSLVARRLRKITRKFNKLSFFRVSVLAVFAWLAWCVGWFVWCCLLDQS